MYNPFKNRTPSAPVFGFHTTVYPTEWQYIEIDGFDMLLNVVHHEPKRRRVVPKNRPKRNGKI